MLNTSIIGIGAAGNKAAIQAILDGVVPVNKVMLLNTTLKDIPEEFRGIAVNFAENSDLHGGCGKERSLSKKLLLSAMKNSDVDFDNFLSDEDDMVTIVTSTEGGTGSGAATVVAKYFDQQLNRPVNMFALTGFEDDARGKQNTVAFFQELDPNYTIHAISNKKFHGSRSQAEAAANKQFSTALRVMLGQDLIDSDQNIDNTDLYKISTSPGYMVVEYAEVKEKIKNVEQFNRILVDMIDNSPTLETPIKNKMPRMALILNLNERSQEFVDSTAQEVRNRMGECFEEFIQRQYNGKQEFIAVICAGMNMPTDEIDAIYQRYLKEKEEASKNKENFFDSMRDVGEDSFDVRQRRGKKTSTEDRRSFFKDFDDEDPVPRKTAKNFAESFDATEEQPALKRAAFFAEEEETVNPVLNISTAEQQIVHKAFEQQEEPPVFRKTNEFVNTQITVNMRD